jgi:serine phosphatase RsbU (regulator of sigma subunit)
VTGTVEKIVSVVPRAIWIMVGVLALLSAALAAGSGIAAVRARRLARQRARLADDVGALQAALLPAVPERMSGVRTSVAYRPAEGPAAGGDFYDLFALGDGRIAVIVGDVSGHGRAALPQTALIRYTARAYLDSGMSPRAALNAAATALEHQLGYDCFATAVLATYDPAERTLAYSCAGHPPPLILGTEPVEPVIAAASPPIGLGLETGRRQTVVALPGAARACFLTDGVLEARTDGELLGVERVEAALAELDADDSAEALLARVVAATDRRPDDMAACLLGLQGRPLAAEVRSEELVLDPAELSGGRASRFLVACRLDPGQVKSALRRARTAVDHAGGAVLRVGFGDGGPRVEIEQARRTFAHAGRARVGGASLGSSVVS